jgi:hypothetical protein
LGFASVLTLLLLLMRAGTSTADSLELMDGTILEGQYMVRHAEQYSFSDRQSKQDLSQGRHVGAGVTVLTKGPGVNIPADTLLDYRLAAPFTSEWLRRNQCIAAKKGMCGA